MVTETEPKLHFRSDSAPKPQPKPNVGQSLHHTRPLASQQSQPQPFRL